MHTLIGVLVETGKKHFPWAYELYRTVNPRRP
jgi:hypothetical protein